MIMKTSVSNILNIEVLAVQVCDMRDLVAFFCVICI